MHKEERFVLAEYVNVWDPTHVQEHILWVGQEYKATELDVDGGANVLVTEQ